MNEYENLGIKFENFCREMFKELGYMGNTINDR